MSLPDALWHLLNLFAPAALTGLIAAAAAKALWHRTLAAVAWHRLALWAAAACSAVTLAGLVLFGQDGRMATYGAMVVACAAALWWRGFRRAR